MISEKEKMLVCDVLQEYSQLGERVKRVQQEVEAHIGLKKAEAEEVYFSFPPSWSASEKDHFAKQFYAWLGAAWTFNVDSMDKSKVVDFLRFKLLKKEAGYTVQIPLSVDLNGAWLSHYLSTAQHEELVRWHEERTEPKALNLKFGYGATGVTVRVYGHDDTFLLNLTEYKD